MVTFVVPAVEPLAGLRPVTVGTGAEADTVMVKVCEAVVAVGRVESFTVTVMLVVPAVVGVPEITAPVNVSPAGRAVVE